ncbi:unnamed protein product [Cuscuta campestris]|uniref:RING-type domain-containing protein n=1 Tax=Cuscuta campestris TaxID=132261 RepID=A0A484N7U5_9ASTE|nr:unnamed protein product [Cuscuta campestris]
MGSKWRKAKMALGLNMCLYVPKTREEEEEEPASAPPPPAARVSDAVWLSPDPTQSSDSRVSMPTTPTPSSSGLRLSKHGAKSSKRTCAICLKSMKPGQGHAIFTAECSHSFHFQCITSNVRHGNQICPVCRAKWKEIPFQTSPLPEISLERARTNPPRSYWPHYDALLTSLRRSSSHLESSNARNSSPLPLVDPTSVFDDDELVDPELLLRADVASAPPHSMGMLGVTTYPELPDVSQSAVHKDFAVLIHLKAPRAEGHPNSQGDCLVTRNSRAPVDLVTVLDVSGSMAGTKLALLKRAMGFVIQHLGPSDRLSVIAFSSSARRLFPLLKMTDSGRREALQAVNSLTCNGGTNIADALMKGAQVMTNRRSKNPVNSIILLSDGQDTYTLNNPYGTNSDTGYQSLLPASMRRGSGALHIPVHTFGFGSDHDAIAMHSISESSGGTFSFIEAEGVIQDAFAQCIGGLLSVVVQDLHMEVECEDPTLELRSIISGSYKNSLKHNRRGGIIEVGDLYAEEERDFLVTLDIPVARRDAMDLLRMKCIYKDPVSKNAVTMDEASFVTIGRPVSAEQKEVSMEVDKQRNRLRAAEAMAAAKAAADRGELAVAVGVVEHARKHLAETASARAGDRLCVGLDAELREMQVRMANRPTYEASGRAYVLSGLSSHSWQRATARGDSTESTSLVLAYKTPYMVQMINRSQNMASGSSQPSLRQARSFPSPPRPR